MNNIQLSASLVLDTSHFTKQLAAVTATMRNFSATAGHTDHGLVNVSQQNTQTIRQHTKAAITEIENLSSGVRELQTNSQNTSIAFQQDFQTIKQHTKSTLVDIGHLSSAIRQLQTDSQASSTTLQQDLQAIRQQTKSALAEIDSLSSGIRQLHANIQGSATGLQPAITHSQQLNNQIKQGSTYSREMASGLDQVQESLRRAVSIAGGLYVLDKAVDAVRQFPALGIKSAASLETMQLGLAGTLASMGKIEGKAIDIAQAQQIAATVTATLQQKAMETAASTEDLVSAYRALLGPGLAAKMSMQQLVDFVVTGVNAVKSIGLQSNQVVQELRDLVAGGIQPASSTLATAIGVTDKDITKIKKEGGDLFGFLMARLSGFEQTSLIYNQTYSGRLDALREGITKLSEQGFSPVFDALKEGFADALNAIGQTETAVLQVNGKMQEITKWKLDPQLVDGLRGIATDMVAAGQATVGAAKIAYEYRDAIAAIAIAYAALKTSQITGAMVGGWTERITSARAAMVADAQAAKSALERATADNAVAIGTARRAAVDKDAAMVALQKAQADAIAAKNALTAATTETQKTVATKQLEIAQHQRTAATAAAAAATQTLSAANAQATHTTAALAAAQRTMATNATAAGLAAKGFGAVVGALGGPIGIAITALFGLAMYWDDIKVKAFGAAESSEAAANRIKSALASSNMIAANAGLEALRASRSNFEREIGRIDAILKNESGLSALDINNLTKQRQKLAQESESVRSEILRSEVEIRKAKENQAKQALELVNGYASPLEQRLGLIKKETKQIADVMTVLPDVKAEYPIQLEDKDKKKKDKEAAKAAKALATEQEQLNNLLQKGQGFSAAYTEKLALLAKHQSKIPVEEYRAAVEQLILTETEAGKTAAKHAEEVTKLQESFRDEDTKRANTLQIQNEELLLQNSLIGKTAIEQAALTSAWEEEKKIREEIFELAQKQSRYESEGNAQAVAETNARIAILKQETVARKQAAAGIAVQKEIQQQWAGISTDIERALTDSLMRGFDSGKGFADSLKDHVKNAFKSMAIRILLQPVMSTINSVGGQLYGQIMGGQPQQGQQVGFGDILDTFSRGKSNYDNLISSAITSNTGQALGLSTPVTYTDAWAAGQNVAGATITTGHEITALGEAASTAGQALGYLPAVMQATEGRYIAAVGSAVGQYFGGPIGSMAGAAIGGLLDDAFGFGDRKPDERRARFGYGASQALLEEGKQTGWTGQSAFGTFRTYSDQWFSDSEMRPAMSSFIDAIESLDNSIADSLTLTSEQTNSAIQALQSIDKEYSFGLQWEDFTKNSKAREQIVVDRYATVLDSVEQGWGDFIRSFSGSFEEFPTYLAQITNVMRDFRSGASKLEEVFGEQISNIKQFNSVAKEGESAAQAYSRLSHVFSVTNRVAEVTGKNATTAFGSVGLSSAEMREKLISAAGGIERLTQGVESYYEHFFTKSEKEIRTQHEIRKALAEVNLVLPSNREGFRALVESLDLSTEAGLRADAVLRNVASAFAGITPDILNVHKTLNERYTAQTTLVKNLADEASKYLSLRNKAGTLLDSIDRAMGKTSAEFAEKRQKELWALLQGAGLEQQIALADELSSLIISRYQTEYEAIERLKEGARDLRQYVQSLKIGDLSPFTMGERLAEAASQYAISFSQAMAGDQSALNSLQGKADTYLSLAKDYYASSSDYAQIFASVTNGLGGLGVTLENMDSSAQSVASAQLTELQRLRDEVSTMFSAAGSSFEQTNTQLQTEFSVLVGMATQLGKLSEISQLLSGLPAELAARLNPYLTQSGQNGNIGNNQNPTEKWYENVNGLQQWNSSGGAYALKSQNEIDYVITATNQKAFLGSEAAQFIKQQIAAGNERAVYDAAITHGISSNSLDAMMGWATGTANNWAKQKGLPEFAIGTNYLPDDMVAVVHKGERIIPAADNKRLFDMLSQPVTSNAADFNALKNEIIDLKQTVVDLLTLLIDVTANSNSSSTERIVQALDHQVSRQMWDKRNSPTIA